MGKSWMYDLWVAGMWNLNQAILYVSVQWHLYVLCSNWLLFSPFLLSASPAGWVLSTTISRASSSSWRGESIPTGKPTAAHCPTTLSASCHFAPSTVLWVAAEKNRDGEGKIKQRKRRWRSEKRASGNEVMVSDKVTEHGGEQKTEPRSEWQLKNRNETTQWWVSACSMLLADSPSTKYNSSFLLHPLRSLTKAAAWWFSRGRTLWAAAPRCATTTPPCRPWAGSGLRWAPCTCRAERKSVLHLRWVVALYHT